MHNEAGLELSEIAKALRAKYVVFTKSAQRGRLREYILLLAVNAFSKPITRLPSSGHTTIGCFGHIELLVYNHLPLGTDESIYLIPCVHIHTACDAVFLPGILSLLRWLSGVRDMVLEFELAELAALACGCRHM